jgi:peptide deformylase
MSTTALKIRLFGDPVLRKRARPVRQITESRRSILSQMAQLMYEAKGIGLAAPQVGISERMIVVDIGDGLYKLINPKIVKRQGFYAMEEGCLSVPSVNVKVRRSRDIILKAQDEDAREVKLKAEGLLACVLQHEIDHLNGRLIVDRAPLLKRLRLGRILEALRRKAGNEKLSQPQRESRELQL